MYRRFGDTCLTREDRRWLVLLESKVISHCVTISVRSIQGSTGLSPLHEDHDAWPLDKLKP